jgi:lipopolysaccharide export system protein LptC
MSSTRRDSLSAPPRRRLRVLGAGYTWFVRIAKVALPLAALVLIGIVIARMSQPPEQRIADIPPQEKTTPGQIELVQAKYEGIDEKGRPYVLTADRASRDMKAAEAVLLDNPKAGMTLKDGTTLSAAALHGSYNNKSGQLVLRDNVVLSHDSGYTMHLKSLSVDVKKRTALSQEPLTAQGPAGTLAAQNIDVADQGALITFGGPVRLTLTQLHKRKPAAPAAAGKDGPG